MFSVYVNTENIHFVCPIGWLEAKFLHPSVREREALVQGADKLLKLYYTWHRHDGLQKSLRNVGSMPASYLAAWDSDEALQTGFAYISCRLLHAQFALTLQSFGTSHASRFCEQSDPSVRRWLFHGDLHSDLDVFACQFLLRHHHQGCCLVDRLSRRTLASDSTKNVLRTPRFRTIWTLRNEETLFNRISIRRKQPRRSSYSTLATTRYLSPFQWGIHANVSEQVPSPFFAPRAWWTRTRDSQIFWSTIRCVPF